MTTNLVTGAARAGRTPAALWRRLRANQAKLGLLSLLLAAMALFASCAGAGGIDVGDGWSGPVVDDGVLYLGTRSGSLIAIKTSTLDDDGTLELDDENFQPLWEFSSDVDNVQAIYSTAVLSPDRLFFAQNAGPKRDVRGKIHALARNVSEGEDDLRPGDLIWSFPTQGAIFGSPVLYEGIIYVADDEGFVYALDSNAGELDDYLVWQREIGEERFWSTPAVSDGVVYVGNMDKRLYALDAEDGSDIWSFKAGGAIVSTPLVLGDRVYVGAFDRNFYAVDRATGNVVWAFEGDGWFWNDAIASPEGDMIYVGSLGGTFYGIRAEDGSQRWMNDIDAKVRAAPLLVGGRVFVVARNGRLLTLNAGTGLRTRTETLNAKALASPVWAENSVWVSDLKETLHRFRAVVTTGG